MDAILDSAARALAVAYIVYMSVLGVTAWIGVHLVTLLVLLTIAWRRWMRDGRFFSAGDRALSLQLFYGFLNPLLYLLIINRDGAMLRWSALDAWLTAVAWTLFAALWGARLLLARDIEVSPVVRAHLHRLCVLGLACLAAFALRDFVRMWWLADTGFQSPLTDLWILIAFAPLYLIPSLMLNGYRARLALAPAPERQSARFLLLPRAAARRMAVAIGIILSLVVVASIARTSDTAARARVERLAPTITAVAERYAIDPTLLAAIVYVSERDVGPFRDQVEQFASTALLADLETHFIFPGNFDVSLGAAQIKPVTALTALKLCAGSGPPWNDLWVQSLVDAQFRPDWQARPSMRDSCQPPTSFLPANKSEVIGALRSDDSNVAFAALILALYQWQWREANPAWDISERPDILATLYQIGFAKSRPHGAPRSNAFGQRVADISREPWLRQHFEIHRVARGDGPSH